MSGDAARALEQTWQRFARAIGGASEILGRSGVPHDPVALAEAYDYWAQVVTFGLRREFHYADRDQPFFHRCGLDTKIGFDNPDNVYEVGTDTFIVRDGKIAAQSFTGKITPKG